MTSYNDAAVLVAGFSNDNHHANTNNIKQSSSNEENSYSRSDRSSTQIPVNSCQGNPASSHYNSNSSTEISSASLQNVSGASDLHDGGNQPPAQAEASAPVEKTSPCGTKKLLCFGNCCKIVKASNPKMPGNRGKAEAIRLWCPPEDQSHGGDGAPSNNITDVEDLAGKALASPRRRSDVGVDNVGLKRTRSESDITNNNVPSVGGCGSGSCGAPAGSTLQQIFARPGMNQDGTCTEEFIDACFPELGKPDFRKFAEQVPLVLVGPSCMPKTMCPVVEHAWIEFTDANISSGNSNKPYISFRGRATTEKNISKMESGTSVYGQAPSVMIVDSSRDAVYVLPISNWKSVLIKRCTRYREARVAEVVEFFTKCRDGTWPRAPRGVKRPFRDQHPQYDVLKSAVQCSWESLVNFTCLGYAPDTYDSTLMKEAVQERKKTEDSFEDPAVVRPKDVLVIFTRNDCAACSKFLPMLNSLMRDLFETACSNVPCLSGNVERAKAWCPLSAVVVNMEENELPSEVTDGISFVPTVRLYPADCSLVADLNNESSENDSEPDATPGSNLAAKRSDAEAYHHEHRNSDGTTTKCSLLAHPPVDFKGNRSPENILHFLKENCRNKETSGLVDLFLACSFSQDSDSK